MKNNRVLLWVMVLSFIMLCTLPTMADEDHNHSDDKLEESAKVDLDKKTEQLSDTLTLEQQLSSGKKRIAKLKIEKKKYDHRHQIGSALGVMIFYALIITATSNFNP